MRWLDSISNSMDMNLSKLCDTEENRRAWHATVHGVANSQTQLSNWTITIKPASGRDNSSHSFRKLRWITSYAACASCILLGFTSNSICIWASISPQASVCFMWMAMPLKGGSYSGLMDSQPGCVGKLRPQPMGMGVSGQEILTPVLWGDNSVTHSMQFSECPSKIKGHFHIRIINSIMYTCVECPFFPWTLTPAPCVCVHAQSLQPCLTLCDPLDCSPPGSSVHGILQARVLEWVAMLSCRGPSQPSTEPTSPASPVFLVGYLLSHQLGKSICFWYHFPKTPCPQTPVSDSLAPFPGIQVRSSKLLERLPSGWYLKPNSPVRWQ